MSMVFWTPQGEKGSGSCGQRDRGGQTLIYYWTS